MLAQNLQIPDHTHAGGNEQQREMRERAILDAFEPFAAHRIGKHTTQPVAQHQHDEGRSAVPMTGLGIGKPSPSARASPANWQSRITARLGIMACPSSSSEPIPLTESATRPLRV